MAPSGTLHRWRHHGLLALGALAVLALTVWLRPAESRLEQLSFGTAWACLVYLAAALAIGPLRVWRTGALRLNDYLRRDVGIWAALTGLVHLFAGTGESMNQAYLQRFVETGDSVFTPALRQQLFAWGSVAGFIVGLLVLLLLVLSSDFALRSVGRKWWKRLQRSAYFVFALTVGHGLAFQALESRSLVLVACLGGLLVIVCWLQWSGIVAHRRVRRRVAIGD